MLNVFKFIRNKYHRYVLFAVNYVHLLLYFLSSSSSSSGSDVYPDLLVLLVILVLPVLHYSKIVASLQKI